MHAAIKSGEAQILTKEKLLGRIEASKKKPAPVAALRIPEADLTLARKQAEQKGYLARLISNRSCTKLSPIAKGRTALRIESRCRFGREAGASFAPQLFFTFVKFYPSNLQTCWGQFLRTGS